VLGAATYNPEANELRFRLPAGVDVFDADGKTRILQPDVFDEIKQAYAEANAKMESPLRQPRRRKTWTFYPCCSKFQSLLIRFTRSSMSL
jgi:hypothetical protein